MIALLLLGVMQLSQWMAAHDVLHHAASRGARAKTVGFNRWMVDKVVDVATIPNAGRMLVPPFENTQDGLRAMVDAGHPGRLWDFALRSTPGSRQTGLERARIPEYLNAENRARARFILDYEDWDRIGYWTHGGESGGGDDQLHIHVYQDYRLWVPMHRTFYAADDVELVADAYIENHYPLYIEDRDW